VKWLTAGGVVAGLAVGAAVIWGLGPAGLVPLFAFFITGSLLTRLSGGSGGQRTARQVIANGGVAAIAAAFGSWAGAGGALAAATADTWATEIGSFSATPPRLITNGAVVEAGTSGGITALGTAGGALGAVLIAAITGSVVTFVAGLVGMFADSFFGATLQRRRWLDNDGVNLAATSVGCGTGLLGCLLMR
jgi:uncharacterized protein (TIGR00297 family)